MEEKKVEEKKSVLIQDIKLVLNKGDEILDSATIPVKWHFSDELIEKKPRYIVICDHEFHLKAFKEILNSSRGYRHGFEVKNLVGYIQLHKPGRHHFVAIVFCGDKEVARRSATNLLHKENPHNYKMPISWENIKSGQFTSPDYAVSAVSIVEFEVPEELFAKKSDTSFGQFVWRWVNRWYDTMPVDECAYRKRKIFAFTLQLPMLLIGRLLGGIIGTLYTLIGAFILLFLGWLPIPIWKNVYAAWKVEDFNYDLRKFDSYSWRIWKWGPRKKIPVWAVPIVPTSCIGAVFGFIKLSRFMGIQFSLTILVGVAFSVVMIAIILKIAAYVKRHRRETKREKGIVKERAQITEDQMYFAFLKMYMNGMPNNVPRSINIIDVIRKVDTATKFRLSFWAAKAKVCRPFSSR